MGRRHTALLVEDDLGMAEELGDVLSTLGHDHVHVVSQSEAEHLIETRNDICYVLLDMQIKANPRSILARVEAGMGVLLYARQACPQRNERGQHLFQVLMMSGHAKDMPWAVKALQEGANDYAVKPLQENAISLADKIRAALQRSGRESHTSCEKLTQQSRAVAATAPVAAQPAGFCLAFESGKPQRAIDHGEYLDLVKGARAFHLFLNLMDTVSQRRRAAGFRDLKGHFHRVSLPTLQALAVAEVMKTRGGLRPADFRLESLRAEKAFEDGRKTLDVRMKSGDWRSLKTLLGDVPAEKRFVLHPSSEIRCLLLCEASATPS